MHVRVLTLEHFPSWASAPYVRDRIASRRLPLPLPGGIRYNQDSLSLLMMSDAPVRAE